MKVLLVSNVETEDESFNEPLLQGLSRFAEVEVINYRNVPSPDRLSTLYDGIVTSGTPLNYPIKDIDNRLPYIQWIKTVDIPVLGVCLGHQNIGRLFGSDLIVDKEAEEGETLLQIVRDSPLFKNVASGEKVLELHRASVSLPDDFILLASSNACQNQAMKHATKPIYSVQFHPEGSGETGMKIFSNFVGLLS